MELLEPFRSGLRDPVASASHLATFFAAVYLTTLFWRLTRFDPPVKRYSVACFGLSMCVLYWASANYHALKLSPERLQFYRNVDQSAIYLLIAGTYTPIFAVLLRGRLRAGMLALMWLLAALGIAAKWLLPAGSYTLTVVLYMVMGMFGMVPLPWLFRAVGFWRVFPALVGAGSYIAGGVFDATGWPVVWPGVIGTHEMLHFCDMFGTATHVYFILRTILPYEPDEQPDTLPAALDEPLILRRAESA
jgi:hemolysin III